MPTVWLSFEGTGACVPLGRFAVFGDSVFAVAQWYIEIYMCVCVLLAEHFISKSMKIIYNRRSL